MLTLSFPRFAIAESTDAGVTTKPAAAVPSGIAVLARDGAEVAAWALAKELYARPSLRPSLLDETRARVLVGNPAARDAPQAVRDLADERASVHGDDGASRALLRSIASQLGVRAVVVVEVNRESVTGAGAPPPFARVFLAESGAFDAARYETDASSAQGVDAGAPASAAPTSDGGMAPSASAAPVPPPPPPRWSGTVASLERAYGSGGPETHAPALATSAVPPVPAKTTESRAFYESPWFWGALGAAAFGGAAVYFATRDNSTGTIHLEMQVPK